MQSLQEHELYHNDMASPELPSRLRYLNDSAHLLASTAPEISKYLMSRRNALIFENNIEQSASQRREVCGACGAIMIIGWEGTLQIESQRSRRDKKGRRNGNAATRAKAVVYTCESCGRETRHQLNDTPIRHKSVSSSSIALLASHQASLITSTANTATPSANSSSKKRAKARKQGLEAILARQKATEAKTSGFGLDLMDFMKKP